MTHAGIGPAPPEGVPVTVAAAASPVTLRTPTGPVLGVRPVGHPADAEWRQELEWAGAGPFTCWCGAEPVAVADDECGPLPYCGTCLAEYLADPAVTVAVAL